jgi:hypothetical protein
MGQFLQVNGDYNIKAGEGSRITLDTGAATAGGEVRITGNLVVEGETVTVEATDLALEDNIIILNNGETGAGITLNFSGIQIDRGSELDVAFLYDDINDTWVLASSATVPNALNYSESNLKLRRILTDSATDTGDLTLIGTGTGVVKVIGTANYEDQVTHDDDVPNKKYVDDSILNNPTFQIVAPQSQDTKVVIADRDITPNNADEPGSLAYLTATTSYTSFGESAISMIVDGSLIGQFYPNRVEIGDLEIGGGVDRNEITNKASITNENIIIRTQGTGKLQTNYAVQLEKIGTVPAYVTGNTLLYAAESSIGTTGVWFVNDSLEQSKQNGELISKNKALVFSMLF